MSALSIRGERTTGQDVRTNNVMAAQAIANIVKSSLGPTGLDKMLVDNVGDVTITNDGATILKQLEVEHPAAKVLVELSALQDQEVGDGTTSVVILAAEILKQANELVKNHVHPTSVISGLLLAKREACDFIAKTMAIKTDTLGKDVFINAAKTAMSSKIIGSEADFFAKLAFDAVSAVKVPGEKGTFKYPIKAINILKSHGKSARESMLVNGFALNCVKASQGMPSHIKNARIALVDIDLRKAKMPMGVQVLITDPKKLEAIRKKEGDITKDRINLLIKAGANVVLTTKGIDDFAMKYFVDKGVMAVRRCKKSDLKNIAKATGGQVLISLADSEGDESIEASALGTCGSVEETRIGDGELLFFKDCVNTKAQTIILRGANDYMLDEIDRSLHDALCIVKRTLESKAVVPGGGAVEAALSVYMEHVASTMGSREQLAIAAFAQALLIIPKTLAVNGAFDATDLIAKLRSYHHTAQTQEEKSDLKWTGLDLEEGKVRDNVKAGVLEPAMSKIKMIKFATEAATTILRIDDSIKMSSKEKPTGPVDDDY
jgi:T-complex protein 1 subunit alpha